MRDCNFKTSTLSPEKATQLILLTCITTGQFTLVNLRTISIKPTFIFKGNTEHMNRIEVNVEVEHQAKEEASIIEGEFPFLLFI